MKQIKPHKRMYAIWHCAKLTAKDNTDRKVIRESEIDDYAREFLINHQEQYCTRKDITPRMFSNFVGDICQILIDEYEKDVKWIGQ